MSTLFKRLPYILIFLSVFLFAGAKRIQAVLVCDPTCYYGSSQCSARVTPKAGYTCQRADAKCVSTCNTTTGEWCWAFCANLTPTNTPRPPTATVTPKPPTVTPTPRPCFGSCYASLTNCNTNCNGGSSTCTQLTNPEVQLPPCSWPSGSIGYCCMVAPVPTATLVPTCAGTVASCGTYPTCNVCNADGWYVMDTHQGCNGTNQLCTYDHLEFRDYSCVGQSCTYTASSQNTPSAFRNCTACPSGICPSGNSACTAPACAGTVASCGVYPTCNTCPASGWFVTGSHQACSGSQLCTYDDLRWRTYSCSSQTCSFTLGGASTSAAYNCSVCPSGVCSGSACTAVSTATPIPAATNTPVPSATPTPTLLPAPSSITAVHYACNGSSCPLNKYYEVVQWASVTGAASYKIYRCLGTGCVMNYVTPLTTTGAGVTNYTDYNSNLGFAYLWDKSKPFSLGALFFRQAHAQAVGSVSYEVKAVSAGGIAGSGVAVTDIIPVATPTPTITCNVSSGTETFTYDSSILSWFNTTGGDIHSKGVISVLIPSCSTTGLNFSKNGAGGSPGVVTWEGASNQVGVGSEGGVVSSTNWQAKLAQNTDSTGFNYLVNSLKVERVYNMGEDCSTPHNNCKVPEVSGTYYVIAPEVVIKEGADIEDGDKVVIFVDGNATISKKDITVDVDEGGFFALIASGNITFKGSASDYVTKAQGFFLADGQIITEAGDKSFEGQGSFIARGGFDFNRTLADNCTPAETFIDRPDLLINAPIDFTLSDTGYFQEIAP